MNKSTTDTRWGVPYKQVQHWNACGQPYLICRGSIIDSKNLGLRLGYCCCFVVKQFSWVGNIKV